MTGSIPSETPAERHRRHQKRSGFDAIARSYDAARPTYPGCLVEEMLHTAGVHRDADVLEVGCGTGQLTRDLARAEVALTAIDPGPSMIDVARGRVRDAAVQFVATTFEDYDAHDQRFQLIASAAAFHWVDPDIWWTKTHELLLDGGWLAILDGSTRYEDSLHKGINELWVRHSETGAAWASTPSPSMQERFESSGLFEDVRHGSHSGTRFDTVASVQALAETTATFLAYRSATQAAFRADLAALLSQYPEPLRGIHTSSLWIARRRSRLASR